MDAFPCPDVCPYLSHHNQYLLIPIGLKYLSTTLVALYGYIILIVATIVSLSIGQDRFSWYQMIAIALICSSVYFVEIAESKDKR